jgi:O-antigen ligase
MASAILAAAGVLQLGGARPVALVALIGMAWFLAEYRLGNRNSLWWSLAVLLGITISLSRTALLGAFVLIVATLLFAYGRHRARNVILCVLLLASGYWAVTYWAPLRDRFVTGDVSLSVGGISTNAEGRTRVWTVLWSEAQDEPLIGRGAGAASARSVLLDPAFDQPHNDYLRIFYDFGVIGLGLLAWFLIRSVRLLRYARIRFSGSIPALAALNAELALLVVMAATNPLDAPFFMIPLGALVGLGLGSGLVAGGVRQPVSAAR